jgi:hypothetical protein
MANPSDPLHLDRQSAGLARDRARARVRRVTTVIALASTAAAGGLGMLVASDTVAHSATTPATTPATTSSGQSSTGSSTSSGSQTTSPSPTTTTTTPTVVSGQS